MVALFWEFVMRIYIFCIDMVSNINAHPKCDKKNVRFRKFLLVEKINKEINFLVQYILIDEN
jgi:hypothetical protein